MNRLVYMGIGLPLLWLQVSLTPYLHLFGLKPNLLLTGVLVLSVRWLDPWLFVFAAGAGLSLDVFSHGMLGLYATSFCIAAIAGRVAGMYIYESNWLFTMVLVMGLSLLEGIVAISLMAYIGEGVSWWAWLFTRVVPVSLYHGVLAPLFFVGLLRLERLMNFSPPGS